MLLCTRMIVFEEKKIVIDKYVNEGLSLTFFNERINFMKTVVLKKRTFWKKLHGTFLNVVLHEVKKLWGN